MPTRHARVALPQAVDREGLKAERFNALFNAGCTNDAETLILKLQSFEAMAGYLENLPLSASQLDEERSLSDLPLVVLSARTAIPEHAHDAALSTRGRHIVVPESGHWIQLDAPDTVVEAITSLL